MKETELQELEQALRAACPAPWRAAEEPYYLATHYSVRDANDWTIVTDESGDGSDTAAIAALRNKAPDLIAALREARRLLGQTHRDYCRATCPGHWDGDGITWVPSVHEAICQDVAAFLGEQKK